MRTGSKLPGNWAGWSFAIFSAMVVYGYYPAAARAQVAATQPAASTTQPSDTENSVHLFTESFENGLLNKEVWSQQVTGDNVITVQQDKVAHGKFALKVQCPAPSNKTWAFINTSKIPKNLSQHHFGRAYMFITAKVPTRHTILLMAGTPGFPKNRFQEVATAFGRWQLTYVDLTPARDNEDYHAGGPLPLDRWFCLEWEFNDHPNHTKIWVDREPVFESDFVSKVSNGRTDLVGGFTDYAFGFRLWGSAPAPFDIYFDDIALDTRRIGPIDPSAKP